MSAAACSWSSTQKADPWTLLQSGRVLSGGGIPGAPVDGVVIGNMIWSCTTCVNVEDFIPASREAENALSRFGPIVPAVPASASVWQPPQDLTKSCLPEPWLPLLVYPPVPQPANANVATTAHATRTRAADVTPASLTGAELLQQSLHVRGGGVSRRELQEFLVRRDRGRRVADLLRYLSEVQLCLCLVPLVCGRRRDLLVGAHGALSGALLLADRLVRGLRDLGADGRVDRVDREWLALQGEGSQHGRTWGQVVGAELRVLGPLLGVACLAEVEPGELAESVDVPRSKLRKALERRDRAGRVPLRLVRGREVAEGLRVLRVLVDALLRTRDRRDTGASTAFQDVPESDTAGADPEAHETEPEDQGEEDEHPLRMSAKPGEEHGVLDYDVARARDRSRLRALCASAISSGHASTPFS